MDRAVGYGIPGEEVDGNDVVAVHEVVQRAVAHARAGGGPTLVVANTMRMDGHAFHDAAEYVPAALLEAWAAKDPVDRCADRLRLRRVGRRPLPAIRRGAPRRRSERRGTGPSSTRSPTPPTSPPASTRTTARPISPDAGGEYASRNASRPLGEIGQPPSDPADRADPAHPVAGGPRLDTLWANDAFREQQEHQMRFLLEHTERAPEIPALARAYTEHSLTHAYLRFHPRAITRQPVRGIEWLTTRRDPARGVLLSFAHHNHYDGMFALAVAGSGRRSTRWSPRRCWRSTPRSRSGSTRTSWPGERSSCRPRRAPRR